MTEMPVKSNKRKKFDASGLNYFMDTISKFLRVNVKH